MNFLCFFIGIFSFSFLSAEVLQKEGKGMLEKRGEQCILHLKGSPYEMGYQQGVLLKPMIEKVVAEFIDSKKTGLVAERFESFAKEVPQVLSYIPSRFMEEMKGLAEGSGIALEKVQLLNLFPEMFHCSGIVALPDATDSQTLYHVRVLDYRAGKGLEKVSILMAVEPEGYHPFLNVSYAGFIGSVTGMNQEKISLGEIGGLGYGKWDGCPMSFLMREVLEKAGSLQEAKDLFSSAKRTCEYYYLIADGKSKSAVALYATPSDVHSIEPGASYALIASNGVLEGEKMVVSPTFFETFEGMTALYDGKHEVKGLFFKQPEDCLLLTGFAHPHRFPVLFERLMKHWGTLDLAYMEALIKAPVTCETNLHNAIFEPMDLKVSISHAKDKDPASSRTYRTYSFQELFLRPDS